MACPSVRQSLAAATATAPVKARRGNNNNRGCTTADESYDGSAEKRHENNALFSSCLPTEARFVLLMAWMAREASPRFRMEGTPEANS